MKKLTGGTHLVFWRVFIAALFMAVFVTSAWAQPPEDFDAPDNGQTGPVVFLPLMSNHFVQPIIPDSTNVISDNTLQNLVSVSDQGVFTFAGSTPELTQIDVGEVIVGGVSNATPNGFLRKVTDVDVVGNQVIIRTTAATLDEAIQQGGLHISRRLTPNDVTQSMTSAGVDLLETASILEKKFIFSIDEVIYDDDGNYATTNDQVHAKGSISFAPQFDFDLAVQDWQIEQLRMVTRLNEETELEISAQVEKKIEKKKEIYRAYLSPITVFVGPVPVVLTPILTVYIGADGSVYMGVSTSVSQETSITVGLGYENQQWIPIGAYDKNFGFEPPRPTAGFEVRAYTGVQLSVLLYGITGPYTAINAFLEFETDIFDTPWWKLYGGIEAPAGVKIEVLTHELADYEREVLSYKVLLAAARNNHPPNAPAFPNPPDDSTNQNTNLLLYWSASDPDGDALTYDVYFEADDADPDVKICSSVTAKQCDPGVLRGNTHYFWKVVATDPDNAFTPGPVWDFFTAEDSNSPAKVDVALIIDSSGSMEGNDPFDLRKDAAKVFIDAMENGDQVAVIDFDTQASVFWPLQPLSADRSAPKSAVNRIDSSGGTDLIAGLRAGYNQLDSVSNSHVKAALFLTDGQDESGNSNSAILAEASKYASRGWRIFTLGLSNNADAYLLQKIAEQTGGQYYLLNNADQLIQVYFDVLRSATGSTELLDTTVTLSQNQTIALDVTIPSGQTTTNFLTSWQGSTVETTLLDPNGHRITPDSPSTDPNVYHAKTTTSELYRITNPIPGSWRIELFGTELPSGGEDVNVNVTTRDPDSTAGKAVWQAEAETGHITQPLGVGRSSEASACRFIYTVDAWSNGAVTFTFDVPETAYYYPWTRAMGFGWTSNSFFVSIDNQPEFHFEIMPIGDINDGNWDWNWQRLTSDETKEYRWLLSKGTHSIRFRSREPNSRLDVVLFANSETYVPTQVDVCP